MGRCLWWVAKNYETCFLPLTLSGALPLLGFDMSAMKEEGYVEAIQDIVKPETLVSDPVIIKVREWIEESYTPLILCM